MSILATLNQEPEIMLAFKSEVLALREVVAAYRLARKWATGTEEHRLALQSADALADKHFPTS